MWVITISSWTCQYENSVLVSRGENSSSKKIDNGGGVNSNTENYVLVMHIKITIKIRTRWMRNKPDAALVENQCDSTTAEIQFL